MEKPKKVTNNKQIVSPLRRRTWANVNLDCAKHNFSEIRKKISSKICCVIKANAYGHGAVQLASLYQSLGADYLAVSNIEEALQLRQNQIVLPILILGYTSCECARILANNNITQCVFSYEYGMKLASIAKDEGVTVKVHIKIDTGMGRIGFLYRDVFDNEINKAIKVCRAPELEVEGIFMHFAVADEGIDGEKYTREQFQKFINAIDIFKKSGIEFVIRHCANSAAILDYPEFQLDMVRAGIILYGLNPSEQVRHFVNLKPVMSLRSVIAHIKTIEQGQTVSYGRTYTALSTLRVATIPIGYADGFRRRNGQLRYDLCINGKPAQIIGRMCMDQLMVDVTRIHCNPEDEVILFGENPPFTVDEIAKVEGTINYEIVCAIGERVPRAFIQGGKIIEWKDEIVKSFISN